MKKIILSFFLFTVLTTVFSQSTESKNETLGFWKIKNGRIVPVKSNEYNEIAIANWQMFYELFPKFLPKKYITQLVLISDGIKEKTGALGALNDENTRWELVLDVKDVNFNTDDPDRIYQSIYTLIHEFGHLLTLNSYQIKKSNKVRQKVGEPYITAEGASVRSSYINRFVENFWNERLLEEWDVIQDEYCYTEASCVRSLYKLYKDNRTDFVNDYAAESPEEDIAESWTAFILKDKIKEPKTIAEHKINFFYKFPELVRYRKIIRKNIAVYIDL